VELRLWVLRLVARRVYDQRAGRWKRYLRFIVGRRVLLGVDHHPTSACSGRWAWHIHLGLCHTVAFCGPRPRYYREHGRRCRRGEGRG